MTDLNLLRIALRMKGDIIFRSAMIQCSGRHKLIAKFNEVVEKGLAYNNPQAWKFLGVLPELKMTFSDKEIQANYNELMNFLSKGKQLNQDHLDFLTGKGIFADNYHGLIKEVEMDFNIKMSAAMKRYNKTQEEIAGLGNYFTKQAETMKDKVPEEDIIKAVKKAQKE
jgi:glycosyltransferase involved in cell wall biosynthesis